MLYEPRDPRSRRRGSRTTKLAVALGPAVIALSAVFAATRADDPPPNQPPVIEWFAISEQPACYYEFFGYVSDPDNSTQGYTVDFGGVVQGISATVEADGSFDKLFFLPNVQSGIVTADTVDPQGAPAETAMYYLQVTPP